MRWAASYVLVATVCVSAPSAAQTSSGGALADLFRADAAGARPEPAFDPLPVRIGSLAVTPSMTLRAAADSNVFNTPDAENGDLFVAAEPRVGVVTDWSRHRLGVVAAARITRFADVARENSEAFEFGADGVLEAGTRSSITAGVGYAQRIEARGSGGVNIVGGEPAAFNLLTARLAARTEFGAARLGVTATFARRRYDAIRLAGGGSLPQSFRDVRQLTGGPRVDVAIGPSLAAFTSATFALVDSIGGAPVGARRDATGVLLLGGFRSDVTRLVVGEVAVGWRERRFDDPVAADYRGFTYVATVDWYPTELVSVRLATDQDFENSGVPTVAGILARTVRTDIYYDPLRNLRVSASAEYRRERYREIAVSTESVELALRGNLRLGRRLMLGAFASFRDRAAPAAAIVSGYRGVGGGLALTANL